MNKQDIDKASAALTGAINYFSPMVVALNQADEVFSVLSNAIKLKDAIEKEVSALKAEVEPLKVEVVSSKAAITANNAAALEAKIQVEKDIAEAQAQAKVQVKEILYSVVAKTKSAQDAFDVKQAELVNKATQLQSDFDARSAALVTQKTDLEAQIAALQKKLDSITAQAKKFADAIAG